MGDARGESGVTLDFVQELAYSSDPDVTVTSFQVSAGSGRGDNYTSMLYRIKARGAHSTGEPWSKSYVYKCLPASRVRREAFKSEALFRNEVSFYTKALPALVKFQNSKGCNIFTETPKVYLAEPGMLVLEDLKERGFVMADRKKGLDLQHCESVVAALAKFHALSLAMKNLEPENFFREVANVVTECLFEPENEEWYHDYYTSATKNAVSFVRECLLLPEERDKYVVRFENFVDSSFFQRMVDLVQPKEPIAVICHGDCWTNNILFNYSPSGDISFLCFLDFQLVRYGSPALDLVNFLYCCTSRKLRSSHMNFLVDTYCEHLKKSLARLGCSDDVFGEDLGVMDEIRKYGKFGLGLAIDMIPISTCDSDQAPDLYVTVQEEGYNGSEQPVWTKNEVCKRRMTDLVQELVDNGELTSENREGSRIDKGPVFHHNIPYIAHKKLAMVTPSAHGWRVNKSVLLGEIDRIYHKVRPSLAYQPTEDYLNSRSIVSFDDETRSIRAQTAALLKKIYTPIPRAQRPLPLTGELLKAYAKVKNLTMRLLIYPRYLDNYGTFYSHSELPITDRITSDHYIDRLLSAPRHVHNDVLTMSYYDEPAKRYSGIGKGHLACVSFAGGRPISRRRNLASPHDNIRNDINVLSHYGRFRAAAAAANVSDPDYIPPSYQPPTKSAVTGSWKSNAPYRTGSNRSDKSRDSYRPRELTAGAEFDAALERKKKRREALEAAALKEAQEEKRHKQREEDLAKLAEIEKGEDERKQKEEAERLEAERLEAEKRAQAEAERKAKEEEEERLRKEEEEKKAKEEAAKKAEEEKRRKEEEERLAREEAERKAKEEEERRAKEEEERKAKEEAERLAKEEEERKAKEEAERLAKEEEERKAKEEADRLAKEEEERLAKELAEKAEAERLEKEEAERLAREQEEKAEEAVNEEAEAPAEEGEEKVDEAAKEEAEEPKVEEVEAPEPAAAEAVPDENSAEPAEAEDQPEEE